MTKHIDEIAALTNRLLELDEGAYEEFVRWCVAAPQGAGVEAQLRRRIKNCEDDIEKG